MGTVPRQSRSTLPRLPWSRRRASSEVFIVVTDGDILRLLQLLLVLRDQGRVDLDLRGLGELTNELQVALVGQPTGKPQERLLEVVVAAGAQVVVLQVALAVELDVLGLHLPVLNIP